MKKATSGIPIHARFYGNLNGNCHHEIVVLLVVSLHIVCFNCSMGNVWNGTPAPPPSLSPNPQGLVTVGRKRSAEDMLDDDVEELSPRRKKIQTTSTYIYETLFKKGANSDITIVALGRLLSIVYQYQLV